MSVRNRGFVPELDAEGVFAKPLPIPPEGAKLRPFERMHAHQTLASARRYAPFHPFSGLIPNDDLDFILASPYNHSDEFFPDRVDVYLQNETVGAKTWRRLRNTADLKSSLEARARITMGTVYPFKLNERHPVIISGIMERRHPSNLKLMNSSHHSPQTNGGYTRQDADGSFYEY